MYLSVRNTDILAFYLLENDLDDAAPGETDRNPQPLWDKTQAL
jgi:hypothetical protein